MDLSNANKGKLDLHLYGLSGVGLQNKNQPIKVICSHPEYNTLVVDYLLPRLNNLKRGDPMNLQFVHDRNLKIEL